MTLTELMQGYTPDEDYEGVATADDYILAIDFTGNAASVGDYIVANEGVTEYSGSLNPQTKENQYMRSGRHTTKTGTQRSFKFACDRMIGDPFQEALLSHELKYGIGNKVIKDYVYFNLLTGKGEKGKVSIVVEDDPSGVSGDNAGITATMTARGIPTEYTYSAT